MTRLIEAEDGLQRLFDYKEFIHGGFQLNKSRHGSRPCPVWMIDKNLLKEFLVKRFPLAEAGCVHTYWKVVEEERDAAGKVWVTKIKQPRRAYNPNCDCRPCCQYRRAYVWAIVIQICFRSGGVAADVTHLWPKEDWPRGCQLTPAYVRRIIQSINRADRGERLDGLPRSYGKPGRKKGATAATKFKLP